MSMSEIKASSETLEITKTTTRFADVDPGKVIRWTLLFLGGVVMIMPIVFMISTSLKWPHEIYELSIYPQRTYPGKLHFCS